jgi:hypothetical protein
MKDKQSKDHRDTICADVASDIEKRREEIHCKWRRKCRVVADSLHEADDPLFPKDYR